MAGGCIDVALRDAIMSNAMELIRQIIRTHNLHIIYPGRNQASFNDLVQVAWTQIESVLYKYVHGKAKVFNMWCVAPDTLLTSDHGIKTIEDIVSHLGDEPIRVMSPDGLHEVVAGLRRQNVCTIKIAAEMGYEIECSPEHLLLVLGPLGSRWIKAADIRVDDLVCLQAGKNHYANRDDISINLCESGDWRPPPIITPELSYILGLLISEGSFTDSQLIIYNTDQTIIDRLVRNNLGLRFVHYPAGQRVDCCNKRFIELVKKLGFQRAHCHAKTIPNSILNCSFPVIKAFTKGMFDGDGHASRFNGCVGYTSTSKQLINQLRLLLLGMGIRTKLSTDKRQISHFLRRNKAYCSPKRVCYQLICPTEDSRIFYEIVGFGVPAKQEKQRCLRRTRRMLYSVASKFMTLYRRYGPGSLGYGDIRSVIKRPDIDLCSQEVAVRRLLSWNKWRDDPDFVFIRDRIIESYMGVTWLPVRSIRHSTNDVYEIDVNSDNHAYLANGLVSHNSQIAKTVILAHIKKETRDKKNAGPYSGHLDNRHRNRKSVTFARFVGEARETFKYNEEYERVIKAMEDLSFHDDKPYDGFIGKLAKRSGMSKAKVSAFIRLLRLRAHCFTDSGFDERSRQMYIRRQKISHDNEDDDD